MNKKINFEVKEKIVSLSGACFWYWNNFYSFLNSCGVQKSIYTLYPKDTYKKYDVMRNVLEYLENKNDIETINNLISGFYKLNGAIDKDNLDDKKAKLLLKEFKEIVGTDPIEMEIEKRFINKKRQKAKENINYKISFNKKLEELHTSFLSLFQLNNTTPQQRGFELETLIAELLRINEFEYHKSYTLEGEQIDGYFKYEKFDYLVELKWTAETIKQKDLSIFDGKLKSKGQSTRGLFLSINGFDDNAINKFSNDNPRIILMNGEDLIYILNGSKLFYDVLKAKIDAFVRMGKIYLPIKDIK